MVGVKVYHQFNNKLARFNYLIGVKLAEIFKSYLVEEKRPYPRQTNRRYGRGTTGKKAGTVRDVVDSKDLVNSFIWKSIVKGLYLKNEFVWNAPHAMLVPPTERNEHKASRIRDWLKPLRKILQHLRLQVCPEHPRVVTICVKPTIKV